MADDRVEVSLDHIMRDCYAWSDSSGVLRHAANVANQLPVYESQFSYLGAKAGLTEQYEKVRQRMERLFQEGADSQDRVAETLFETAKQYEEGEEEALERLRKVERELEENQ